MKKMMYLMGLLLVSCALMAQEVLPKETAETVIDVTTFGGMMAVVTAIVTQFAKLSGQRCWLRLVLVSPLRWRAGACRCRTTSPGLYGGRHLWQAWL